MAKKYLARLADDDPFRETFRTFEGFRTRFTTTPTEVELTDEEVEALKVSGLVIEPSSQPTHADAYTAAGKGRG